MADLPSHFGPYEVLGPLGFGGMGQVYRARDGRLHRDVALKILPRSSITDPDRHRRFAQEAIAASALNHSNIITVYDVGIQDDIPYLVSELIDGSSLREECDRGRMALKRCLDIAVQIADGLAAAHAAGIVHRDVKPDNVMVTRTGQVKIVDFGIAKTEDAGVSQVTQTATAAGLLIGTVPYMSPEQARGGHVDFRSDQFSLGIVLYEMITHTHPFRRNTSIQTLSAIMGDEAPPLSEAIATTPFPLRWILERLLAKDSQGRYAHTADLAADLRTIRDRLQEAMTAQLASPPPSARRRAVATAGALALAGGLALGLLLSAGAGSDPARLKFTPWATDAGFQGSPSWSPDGKTLAYVAEVDGVLQVFTRTRESPLRNQVTHARFDCHDPFWSPDGQHLYYHSLARDKDALWRIGVTGGPAGPPIVEGAARAAISPDGGTLAIVREDPGTSVRYSLWFASLPSLELQPYRQGPFERGFSDVVLHFSPDGSRLLLWILSEAQKDRTNAQTGFWAIRMSDRTVQRVLPSFAGPRSSALFSWLPDNRRIVFLHSGGSASGTHLWIADVDGDHAKPLTVTHVAEGSPAVSPDGTQIAFTSEAIDFDLVMLPLDGSPARPLLSSTRNELDATWSPIPTASEYAYVTDQSGTQEIWLRSEAGTWDARPIVNSSAFDREVTIALGSLAFSPDGRRIAYQRFSTGAGYRLWISAIAGGPPASVSTSALYADAPTWSPDGESIAFLTLENGENVLVTVPAGGSASPVTVMTGLEAFTRPQWSPDGRWIACQLADGLTVVAPDGKKKRTISLEAWIAYAWSADSSELFGLRLTDDLHHFMLAAVDVRTGRERIVNANVGPIPQANQPIRGLSRAGRRGFVTSVARVRSDIWLLEDFSLPDGLLARLWSMLK